MRVGSLGQFQNYFKDTAIKLMSYMYDLTKGLVGHKKLDTALSFRSVIMLMLCHQTVVLPFH